MRWLGSLLLGAATLLWEAQASGYSSSSSSASAQKCFPDNFLFGSATASYQVEGGVKDTGRTPSIWDDFCREKSGLDCANVADDFLHRYKGDVDMMDEAGFESFRFSISWSRVMNYNTTSKQMERNQPGIDFYHDMIDELLAHNMVPVLTLYHWDLPRELHTMYSPSGWLNPGIVDHFVTYSKLMFEEYGSKVQYWSTFNEPWSFTTGGYGSGAHAPGLTNSTTNTYTVAHNVLNAHAQSVALFRQLKASDAIRSDARIGIVLVIDYAYPLDSSNAKDVEAAERRVEFMLGWFLQPIVSGDYPEIMRQIAGDRLPTFTAEESALLKGSYDLLMLNHYGSHAVTDCSSNTSATNCSTLSLGWERDQGIDNSHRPDGARLSSTNEDGELNCAWFSAYPQGYLEAIKWMHKHDPSADILLTENGWCGNEEIENEDQLWYYQTYLEQVHTAITEEDIPIIGYTAWSLMDNYEWGSFGPRFGLYYVNFTSQIGDANYYTPKATDLERTPRLAAKWFSQVAKTKCLDLESNSTEITLAYESAANNTVQVSCT